MSVPPSVSNQLMLDTLNLHTEIARGAIKIITNPTDHGMQVLSFTELMKKKLSAVNRDQNISSAKIRSVDAGESDDLVGAMVAAQKAGLSFSAMIQIRNRLVQAFDEVMKMPL